MLHADDADGADNWGVWSLRSVCFSPRRKETDDLGCYMQRYGERREVKNAEKRCTALKGRDIQTMCITHGNKGAALSSPERVEYGKRKPLLANRNEHGQLLELRNR